MCETLSHQPWLDPKKGLVTIGDVMRAAADWQLEQVINWIKRNGQDYFDYDVLSSDEFIAELREVMRPQQQEDNS